MAPTPPASSGPANADADLRGDIKLLSYKIDQLALRFDDTLRTYATKTELLDVRDDVKGIKDFLGWGVKIVIGAVLVALLGLVLVKGGGLPKP